MQFLGWLGFGGVIFTVSHLVYSTLGPGDSSSMAPPPSIPPYKGDSPSMASTKAPSLAPALAPGAQLEVTAQIPAQPPPTSEFGVVGADPGAVQFISLCLQYLGSHEAWVRELINLWLHNLNEFTIKSAVEDGMLVEFVEIGDRDKLVPTVTNMTVETMPNDNLVIFFLILINLLFLTLLCFVNFSLISLQLFGGEVTLNLTFHMKISRPVKDKMMIK